jgi:hypothetical protein
MRIEFSKEKLTGLLSENKEKVLSTGIIILALIIAGSIYRNQTRAINTLNLKKDTETKKNILLNEILLSEKKIKFYRELASEQEVSLFTDKIRDMARDFKVDIISVERGPEERQPLYIKYPFVLIIGADGYHAVGKFIGKIESSSDVYFIETLSIRPLKKSQILDKETGDKPEAANRLIINLTLSIISFTG